MIICSPVQIAHELFISHAKLYALFNKKIIFETSQKKKKKTNKQAEIGVPRDQIKYLNL